MLDKLRSGEIAPFELGVVIYTIMILVVIILLARKKNKSLILATIFGIIPIVNVFALFYYVGVPKEES
jgi:hypothetical protein